MHDDKAMSNNKVSRIGYFVLILVVVSLIIFFSAKCLCVAWSCPYPREYRSVAGVQLTYAIAKGINPYSVASDVMEQFSYVYTPLNSVIVALLHAITGIDIVRGHYLLDAIYVICSALMLGFYIYRKYREVLTSLCVIALSFGAGYRLGYIDAVPDHLGVLVSLIIFILVDSCAEISWKRMFTIVFLSVLLFYVKQYFVVVAVSVFFYLLIHNRKQAMTYSALCGILGLVSLYTVNYFCPFFSINVLYFFAGGGDVQFIQDNVWNYTFSQMFLFGKLYLVEIAIVAIGFVQSKLQKKKVVFDIWLVDVVCMFLVLIILGKNTGAWMSYHCQLLLPPVLVLFAKVITKWKNEIRNNWIWIGLVIFVLCYGIEVLSKVYVVAENSYEESTVWEEVYAKLDLYSKEGEILFCSPQLGYYALENDLPLYYNGHGYLGRLVGKRDESYVITLLEKMQLLRGLDDLSTVAKRQHECVMEKVKKGEYILVAISAGTEFDSEMLAKAGYSELEHYDIKTGQQSFPIALYERAR